MAILDIASSEKRAVKYLDRAQGPQIVAISRPTQQSFS